MSEQIDEIACAVLHRDSEGRTIPCPGYPHRDETDGTITMPVAEFRELDLDDFMQGFLAALAEVRGYADQVSKRIEAATPPGSSNGGDPR